MKGTHGSKVVRLLAGLVLAIAAAVTVSLTTSGVSAPATQLAEFDTSH